MGDEKAKKPKPPKLPSGAPRELKDFLACKIMEVDLDPANAGWIPKPDLVPDGLAPTVTPTATGTNSVSVSVGWGFVSLTLPVTITNGQLQVDSTNMPGKQGIDDWVKSFNDALAANNKELSGLEIRNGKIHLTKRVIGAAQPTTTPAPVTPPVTPPATTPPPVTPPTTTDGGDKTGCLIGIILALVLVLGVGIVYMMRDDDSSSTSDTPAPSVSSSSTTSTVEPLDEGQICADLELLEEAMEFFGVTDPCEIDPEDFWDFCDDKFMPCFRGSLPLIVYSPVIGIKHDGANVTDAVTGQTGPSNAEHQAQVVGPLSQAAELEIQSQCGGSWLTGRSPLMETGVTVVKHPLLNYGQCTPYPSLRWGDMWYRYPVLPVDYEVTADPVDSVAPDVTGLTVPTASSFDAAGTTLGLFGLKPLAIECTYQIAPQHVVDRAALCPGDRWVFNAGLNDPRVVSYGAGYVNPLGVAAPTPEQMQEFGDSRLFGPGTLFPCGRGHLGYTVCPEGQEDAKIPTSAFVAGTVVLDRPVPELDPTAFVEVTLIDEYTVRLQRDGDSWSLGSPDGSDTWARAVLRGNSVTFMVPFDEVPEGDLAYSITVGDANSSVPQLPQPVLGVVTSAQGPETPADFFRQMSASIATGDLTYALGRLHPLVLEAFGEDACRTELELRVVPDYEITVDSVGEVAPWTWELPDGRSFDIEAATTVMVRLPSVVDLVEAHLVNIDKQYYWFTICDGR